MDAGVLVVAHNTARVILLRQVLTNDDAAGAHEPDLLLERHSTTAGLLASISSIRLGRARGTAALSRTVRHRSAALTWSLFSSKIQNCVSDGSPLFLMWSILCPVQCDAERWLHVPWIASVYHQSILVGRSDWSVALFYLKRKLDSCTVSKLVAAAAIRNTEPRSLLQLRTAAFYSHGHWMRSEVACWWMSHLLLPLATWRNALEHAQTSSPEIDWQWHISVTIPPTQKHQEELTAVCFGFF